MVFGLTFMKARKYLISVVILGFLIYLIFVQLACGRSVEPVRVVALSPRGLDFQKKIERYFSADRAGAKAPTARSHRRAGTKESRTYGRDC